MNKKQMGKYQEKLEVDMTGKRNTFTFPSVDKIVAYAATQTYGKDKKRWTFANDRPPGLCLSSAGALRGNILSRSPHQNICLPIYFMSLQIQDI
jgi:hypothetical protein